MPEFLAILGSAAEFYKKCFKKSRLNIWVELLGVFKASGENYRILGKIFSPGEADIEDDLRSGGLLCFISMNTSVCTELADSMVTPGEPGGD